MCVSFVQGSTAIAFNQDFHFGIQFRVSLHPTTSLTPDFRQFFLASECGSSRMGVRVCRPANEGREASLLQRDLQHFSVPSFRSLSNPGAPLTNPYPAGTIADPVACAPAIHRASANNKLKRQPGNGKWFQFSQVALS